MPPKWAQPQAAPAPAPAAPAAAAAAPSPVPAGNLDAVETLQVVVPEPAQNGKAWPVDSWKADPNAPDNYAQFTAAINDMSKEPGGKLTLAPNAVYKFTTENIFYIRNLRDVVIDGQGATLLFHRTKTFTPFIQFDNCHNVKLINLSIDWDWSKSRVASLVKVVAANPTSITFDFMEVDNMDPALIRDCIDMHPVNEATMTVGQFNVKEYWNLQGTKFAKSPTKPSHLVATLPRAITPPPPVGQTYLLRHFTYEGHGIVLYNSRNMTFENFNIWSTIGMGLVLQDNCEYFAFKNFKITKKPGEKRLISAAADGIHCNKSLGHLFLDQCEIMYQGDDALNVHDPIARGFKIAAPDTILIANIPAWKIDFKAGDTVELLKPDFSQIPFKSIVKGAARDETVQGWRVQFSDPMPIAAGTDTSKMIILNHRWNAGFVVVQNSKFGANRARGLLLECHDVLVKNNTFWRTQLSAIRMEADVGEWDEGIGTKNVVVVGNTFEDCDVQNWGHGVIWMGAGAPAKEACVATPFHHNIRIKSNQFLNMPGNVVTARSCGNIEVVSNTIVPPGGGVSAMGLGRRSIPAGPPPPSAGPNMGIVIDQAAPGVSVAGNSTQT